MTSYTISRAIKAIDDWKVRGKAVIFDTPDVYGDIFTKDTNFGGSRPFVGMEVMYDHALTSVKGSIGKVTDWVMTDDGIDVEIEINKHLDYAQKIMDMVKMGIIGLSTGALPHTIIQDSQAKTYKRWTVGELSLTPQPAAPHTIFTVKHMQGDFARTAANHDVTDHNQSSHTMESIDMDKSLQEFADTVATKAATAALDAYTKAQTGDVVPGGTALPATLPAPALKAVPASDPYDSNEYVTSFRRYIKGVHTASDNEVMFNAKSDYNRINNVKSLNEGTANDGGSTVPTLINREIITKRDQDSILSQMQFRRILVDSWKYVMPAQGTKGAVGVKTEGGSATASTSNIANTRTIQLYNESYEWELTDELRDDTASNIEEFIINDTARAMSVGADAYIVSNANSTGLLNRVTNSVALSASTLTSAQVVAVSTGIGSGYAKGNAVGWLMRNATWGALRTIDLSNYNRITDWSNGIRYVEGSPVGIAEDMGAVATGQKSLIFGNFSFAAFVERRSGVTIERFRDTRTQKTYITATWRYGFDVIQPEAFVLGTHA